MCIRDRDMLVDFSHEQVGEAVARHLLAKGHRTFGMVWADDTRAHARRRGFIEGVQRHGRSSVEVVTVAAPSTLTLGRQGLALLIERGVTPTAICLLYTSDAAD